MRVLLTGDSHLARLGPGDLAGIADRVTNVAVGGAVTTDLAGQIDQVDLTAYDVVVLSVGTNDAAPWKQVQLVEAGRTLSRFVAALGTPVVYVASPGVDESRLVRGVDRTNAALAEYCDLAARLVAAAEGTTLHTPSLLAPLGRTAFLDDGLHLTPAAYELLVPAIARAVAGQARATSVR